jgi:hypothetical protein
MAKQPQEYTRVLPLECGWSTKLSDELDGDPPNSACLMRWRKAVIPRSWKSFLQYRHIRIAHQLQVQCSWSSSMWHTEHSTGACLFRLICNRAWLR